MQAIDLCDEVEVSLGGRGVRVSCDHPGVPAGPLNIAHRAAAAFLAASRRPPGVRIRITKRIPPGAGLGGGSSNAAAVLRALAALTGDTAAGRRLPALARRLGADVPFFLFGDTAVAAGIGERLTPAEIAFPLWLAVVYPGVSVSTAWAYGRLDALRSARRRRRAPAWTRRRFAGLEDLVRFLHNDLEEVAMGAYPVIGSAREALLAAGARGALMTGSGSAVFGLFPGEEEARAAARRIRRTGRPRGWRVFVARGLGPHAGA